MIRAIETDVKNRNPQSGLIFHSDRGTQYCSTRVRKTLERHGIRQSRLAKTTCYDNAVLE